MKSVMLVGIGYLFWLGIYHVKNQKKRMAVLASLFLLCLSSKCLARHHQGLLAGSRVASPLVARSGLGFATGSGVQGFVCHRGSTVEGRRRGVGRVITGDFLLWELWDGHILVGIGNAVSAQPGRQIVCGGVWIGDGFVMDW
jgi:hypothetical protein